MPSIQRKIQVGYYAFATAVASLALLAYSDLTYLERHIAPDIAASRLLDSVLEIRRYEKNWFLYGTDSALREVRTLAEQTRELIDEARPRLEGLGGVQALDGLEQALRTYRAALEDYADQPSGWASNDQSPALELRRAGHHLAGLAETIAQTQHAQLARAVGQSRVAVLATGALAIVLAVVAAKWLAGRTTRPLGLLVDRLQAIAEGRYDQVTPVSRDREILAVTSAVNHMLGELEARRRHLVQSEKLASLGTLVSGVAHELNNPLSNVSSSCQILAEELKRVGAGDGLQEWLEQIDGETERARTIVASLLDFSRDSAFRKRPVALGALVERTLRLIKRHAGAAPIQVEIPTDLRVSADPQRLQQVLLNLIRNALDAAAHADPGQARRELRIRIKAQRLDAARFRLPETSVCGRSDAPHAPNGRLVLITVEDDGPGIPEAVLPRVFDPFFTTKDVGHGAGLGLYVSQEIVHQHGGCIGVENLPGSGARFLVALPDSLPPQDPRTPS